MRRFLLALLLMPALGPLPAFADEPVLSDLAVVLEAASDEDLSDLSGWVDEYLRSGSLPELPPSELEASAFAQRQLSRALRALQASDTAVSSAQVSLERAGGTLRDRASDLAALRRQYGEVTAAAEDMILALASETSSLAEDAAALTLLRGRLAATLQEKDRLADGSARAQERHEAAQAHLRNAEEGFAEAIQARAAAAARFSLLMQQLRLAAAGRVDLLQGLRAAPSGCPLYAPASAVRLPQEPASYSAQASASDAEADASLVRVLELCERSAALAPSEEAAAAVRYAFRVLGAPYACAGVGRSEVFRFDCSSFVSRAYWEGAGVPVASASWAPSTRDMVPWDGHQLAGWLTRLDEDLAMPGDLALFDTGLPDSRHVVMLLADGLMVHTSTCGDVLHIAPSWMSDLPDGAAPLGVRRVVPELAGEAGLSFWYGEPLDDVSSAVEGRSDPFSRSW